jgi:hypothetical protein
VRLRDGSLRPRRPWHPAAVHDHLHLRRRIHRALVDRKFIRRGGTWRKLIASSFAAQGQDRRHCERERSDEVCSPIYPDCCVLATLPPPWPLQPHWLAVPDRSPSGMSRWTWQSRTMHGPRWCLMSRPLDIFRWLETTAVGACKPSASFAASLSWWPTTKSFLCIGLPAYCMVLCYCLPTCYYALLMAISWYSTLVGCMFTGSRACLSTSNQLGHVEAVFVFYALVWGCLFFVSDIYLNCLCQTYKIFWYPLLPLYS